MMFRKWFAGLMCLGVGLVGAQETADAPGSELQQASAIAMAAAQHGPREIQLGSQALLKLPAYYAYIPAAEASGLMTAMGNHTDSNFHGLIIGEKLNGFVSVRFDPAGFIKDDDAKDWNADELLKNLKEGTEAGNADRRARGIPEFEVTGWIEKPAYDGGSHRLVWSAALQDKGARADSREGVNYNTYLLGREGYLSLNLVSDRQNIEAEKPMARELLAAVAFNDGKRYQDFNAGTDKVAEYGLAALVGGIAAKKLGLLATLGIFLAKAWKLVALAVVAIGAGIGKFFRDRGDDAA